MHKKKNIFKWCADGAHPYRYRFKEGVFVKYKKISSTTKLYDSHSFIEHVESNSFHTHKHEFKHEI